MEEEAGWEGERKQRIQHNEATNEAHGAPAVLLHAIKEGKWPLIGEWVWGGIQDLHIALSIHKSHTSILYSHSIPWVKWVGAP